MTARTSTPKPALKPLIQLDLAKVIKGMYRMLDLINEDGSGGLVDKIIISQYSLQEFINALSPGAYASLTKVDFKKLDLRMIQPIGVYGSKSEIVRFLRSIGVVDETISRQLLTGDVSGASVPSLTSGLYLIRSGSSSGDEQVYVLYWPEDTTWDDGAASAVRRNRVTFMRYLMKMCDQVVALVSDEHSRTLVLDESDDDYDSMDIENDDSDRLFTFEVSKTNEQEENVTTRPGFKLSPASLALPEVEIPSDCAADADIFVPKLLPGETAQGIMTAKFIKAATSSEPYYKIPFTKTALKALLKNPSIVLDEGLDDTSVEAVIDLELQTHFATECSQWKSRKSEITTHFNIEEQAREKAILERLQSQQDLLKKDLREALVDEVMKIYPMLKRERLSGASQTADAGQSSPSERIAFLKSIYIDFENLFARALRDAKFDVIKGSAASNYKDRKEGLVVIQFVFQSHKKLEDPRRQELIDTILNKNILKTRARESTADRKTGGWRAVFSFLPTFGTGENTDLESHIRDARKYANELSDATFLSSLKSMGSEELENAISDVEEDAYAELWDMLNRQVAKLTPKIHRLQEDQQKQQLRLEVGSEKNAALRRLRLEFINVVNSHVVITSRERNLSLIVHHYTDSYQLTGRKDTLSNPEIEYCIQPFSLSAEHRHAIQLDLRFVPSPLINPRLSYSFSLPIGHRIEHAQLLENNRALVVILAGGKLLIYLERLESLALAISRQKHKKLLHVDKIGPNYLFVFDEAKRALAVCSSANTLQLHVLAFDEQFAALQAQGSAKNLDRWYNTGVTITRACFVTGSEEILLVDSGNSARIFSLITEGFRPASLQLPRTPEAVFSSPDGSCLLVATREGNVAEFSAYHWATFGSNDGIPVLIDFDVDSAVLTAMVNRSSIHFIGLNVASRSCKSIALDITHKITEFMFKEKGAKNSGTDAARATAHNCLIDCHEEVWVRFPVLPAVGRRTITSSSERRPKSLTFITSDDSRPFSSYFSEMISTFERKTRKPTGQELSRITVLATRFPSFLEDVETGSWEITRFRAGEWLVDFLCLIPIHIAVCRDNRFVPLKDGVSSTKHEKSLLGAEVNRIVDSLSFGWYESIFQSYLASKPVKVVSSMGEQSVGKSFALNHLVDTSFAGSAMRTTEGVWMSVTPTDDALIVALDFEGVHSIERSAQEDTLLVLFNTAISNLVLFRNNFALSRDITGLFQSFQSSATVLDPAANPTLFQSTLVIIIKASAQDVVDSDKAEVTREFSLKFQRIVQDEQDSNFISRLHAGRLNIIPWPVIESKEFYKLFPTLKKRLDQQKLTHQAAGEFLLTLKTLMAKLKANDWGALSQTMAAHRARALSSLLPMALETGFAETEPEYEALKNLDTDIAIDCPDTPARFFLSMLSMAPAERERRLSILLRSWPAFESRQNMPDAEWAADLALYLNELVDMRTVHVQEWLDANLTRFQAGHASIDDLRRAFDALKIDLRSNVQLCRAQCTSCQLICVQGRQHEGEHHCQTNHECSHICSFCEAEGLGRKNCGMIAGHSGRHICVVGSHLCGETCELNGKQGCLGECTKVLDHADEGHMCSASVHMCGEPCALRGIKMPNGKIYACPNTCRKPSDEEHIVHSCENRLCPVSCQLCKRLCAQDHLHGLLPGETHLCGYQHACVALCRAQGICEIETAPQSVEDTFTGRHETFQYTKYTQVAKRLQCVKQILPGETEHEGDHAHSTDKKPFHYCETRCEGCGYFCTLPLGHTQQEHETSHGSMSRTRWAVAGPDGTAIDLNGRKFSANDEGAPMMCNLFCSSMGRHAHVDFCRAAQEGDGTQPCEGAEVQHISEKMTPEPDRPKDWITHSLHWRRMDLTSSVDPYSRDDQANFAKCDAMCSGNEHTQATPAVPSYCTLPIFHPPRNPTSAPAGLGYVSNDGHMFGCKNPVVMQQAFHVIFVIDRSGSMSASDRRPLANAPGTDVIRRTADNRLGAVFSALYSFWSARHTAVSNGGPQARRDAYTIVMFDSTTQIAVANDFTSSPDQLLAAVLNCVTYGGTNFTRALREGQAAMQTHWSTERTPIMIFLSDGECSIGDDTVHDLARTAVRLGKPLSFHAVSFGPDSSSSSLRRMAQIAREVQTNAPHDPLLPAAATVPSSYAVALDTVRLAETFLGIAESLRKPRGSLLHAN
ncbi:hypothetical protein FA95DRAFT_1484280 [Auriscalpium vulgare]|uniref:Uncharacterized protein n=1 Tax=Auriscalpium vulgare TaxID=40419 RepID=A0ACB8S7E9_9AGAM|nr:hypothetical protein FA95DRAFT_1484280 [Auriscalpium vulgare]